MDKKLVMKRDMGARPMLSSSLPSSPSSRRRRNSEMEGDLSVNVRKILAKQVEAPRDVAWDKRRRQIVRQERRRCKSDDLTDEDLKELKGSIELGFGFKEDEGQRLSNTLPALDFYFAVNRQVASSPTMSPHRKRRSYSTSFLSMDDPNSSPLERRSQQTLKICSPGDDPQYVKTKLRHWAQAVACSVKQTY